MKGGSNPRRDAEATRACTRIDIGMTTQKRLETLPGIGPVITSRIIEGRPYRSVDELDRIKKIGKERPEKHRPLVRSRTAPWSVRAPRSQSRCFLTSPSRSQSTDGFTFLDWAGHWGVDQDLDRSG